MCRAVGTDLETRSGIAFARLAGFLWSHNMEAVAIGSFGLDLACCKHLALAIIKFESARQLSSLPKEFLPRTCFHSNSNFTNLHHVGAYY